MPYTLEEISRIVGGTLHGDGTQTVSLLLTDSRSLSFPEQTLFFALTTSRNDGHRYIDDLRQRGVHHFVVSSLPPTMSRGAEASYIVVPDTLKALQALCAAHRRRFNIPIVAITGSNGKTTVKEWLYQLLSPDMNVVRSPRSYNSQIGVPLSLWLINTHTDLALIEAGISQPGEMAVLRDMIHPTTAVITNIGQAHQENFTSMAEKEAEKRLLLDGAETAIVNRQVEGFRLREVEKDTTTATIKYEYRNELGQYTIPFIDDAAIENSLTCFTTCLTLHVNIDDIARRMARLEPVAMRLEVKEGRDGCTLINDTYNSDVHSLDIALDFMARRPDMEGKTRTLILSDILQSGESPRSLYSRVAQTAQLRGIQKLIGVGDEIVQCAAYFPMESHFFRTTDELLQSPLFSQLHDEFILIKGARCFHFDRLSEALTQKVHQTILEVNLNALVDNLNYYRQFKRPEVKMVCMVKADAYGIGAIEASKTLQEHGVDYLAVAVADEGATLRQAGITTNIMVMNPEMTSFRLLFDHSLEPEVYNFDLLEALIHAAEREGITGFPVHIKLDTGMHRLGFHPVIDLPRLIDRLSCQTALLPRSVFSHFVGSDDDGFDDFSREQFRLFDVASQKLQAAYSHKILRHICNSAGIEHFPQYHLDMVRLGLGLYGINPRTNQVINNVATLKTTILQVRDVPAGDSIGYSRRTTVSRPSRVAAIPIGYADGLNRRLGNRNCYCLVHGQRAPYLGNICMDVCMIDVTDIPDAREGDLVTIFGADIPVTVLSDAIGTIPYEVLTGISQRVQKVFVQE
ncbi:MAG: bifunctional UDP-N-acetylmuramoyl-tripeptide:D-alanyl-D-alanine ligase/alanine racemase [Bacteroidales bacterium]|nr:bifunctional UDP-N-acetylmuramoyl-tripeptide:D-alanyl-D-alanine ligase/alanine racemase [Bacteroidales bacterium]